MGLSRLSTDQVPKVKHGWAITGVTLVLCMWMLGGCASTAANVALGRRYESRSLSNTEVRLVVLWPTDDAFGSAVTPRVLVNGIDIGKLEPLGYLDAIVAPGEVTVAVRYRLHVRWEVSSERVENLVVVGVPGSEVFVEYNVNIGAKLVLKILPTETAAKKVKLVRKSVQN